MCQLDNLRKCIKRSKLQETLRNLPKTLDATYERILCSIDQDYEEDVLKILRWLCFTIRPITLDEMVEVLATDISGYPCFRPEERLPRPSDVLMMCSTLVIITNPRTGDMQPQIAGNGELRLAHFSVKEYLISGRGKDSAIEQYILTKDSAYLSIIKTCLGYLFHFDDQDLSLNELGIFLLSEYAVTIWTIHYENLSDEARDGLDDLFYGFMRSDNECFVNCLRMNQRYFPWNIELDNAQTAEKASPLHYALLHGKKIIRKILAGDVNVNVYGGYYGYALQAACIKSDIEIVQLLLEKGADINAHGGEYGTALQAASYFEDREMIELLLNRGADVNAQGGEYGTALQAASCSEDKEMVELLLKRGADVNAQGGKYGNALQAACIRDGDEEMVQLLLERGANVNAQGGFHGNALQAAMPYL